LAEIIRAGDVSAVSPDEGRGEPDVDRFGSHNVAALMWPIMLPDFLCIPVRGERTLKEFVQFGRGHNRTRSGTRL
jgi:hypothetical protein